MKHYLYACQGEFAQQAFSVKVVDEDGNILVDEAMTTLQNGFLNSGFREIAGSFWKLREGISQPKA